MFPLGTDFDTSEQRLAAALRWLQRNSEGWRRRIALAGALASATPRPEDTAALERMGLGAPRAIRETMLRRLVALGLRRTT